jgi:hypothetical protein
VLAALAFYLLTDSAAIGSACPCMVGSPLLLRKRPDQAGAGGSTVAGEYLVVRRTEQTGYIAVAFDFKPARQ